MDNATWNTGNSSLTVGGSGTGTLTIQNGGSVTSGTIGSNCYIGSTGAGTATVEDANSKWIVNSALYVGQSTNSSALLINNGGSVSVAGVTNIGPNSNSGTLAFGGTGGTLSTVGLYTRASSVTGSGTILTHGLVSDVNLNFGGTATIAVNLGTAVNTTVDMSAASGNSDLGVGYSNTGSTSTLSVTGGATIYSASGYLGYLAGCRLGHHRRCRGHRDILDH